MFRFTRRTSSWVQSTLDWSTSSTTTLSPRRSLRYPPTWSSFSSYLDSSGWLSQESWFSDKSKWSFCFFSWTVECFFRELLKNMFHLEILTFVTWSRVLFIILDKTIQQNKGSSEFLLMRMMFLCWSVWQWYKLAEKKTEDVGSVRLLVVELWRSDRQHQTLEGSVGRKQDVCGQGR